MTKTLALIVLIVVLAAGFVWAVAYIDAMMGHGLS